MRWVAMCIMESLELIKLKDEVLVELELMVNECTQQLRFCFRSQRVVSLSLEAVAIIATITMYQGVDILMLLALILLLAFHCDGLASIRARVTLATGETLILLHLTRIASLRLILRLHNTRVLAALLLLNALGMAAISHLELHGDMMHVILRGRA